MGERETPRGEDAVNTEEDGKVELESEEQSGAERRGAEAKAKPRARAQQKGPEARARDERVAANNALYEHLSDAKLEEVLPKTSEGKTTSIGAMLHASETCAICIFHHTLKGCYNGLRCKFCHAEHAPPARRKRKKKDGEGEPQTQSAVAGQPGDAAGGRRRPRRRGRRRRLREPQESGSSSDEGSERSDAIAENGGSLAGEAPKVGWPPMDTRGNSRPNWLQAPKVGWPPLDSRGNSRPCWLQDQDPSTSWPYGYVSPAFGGYGPPSGYSQPPPQHHGSLASIGGLGNCWPEMP